MTYFFWRIKYLLTFLPTFRSAPSGLLVCTKKRLAYTSPFGASSRHDAYKKCASGHIFSQSGERTTGDVIKWFEPIKTISKISTKKSKYYDLLLLAPRVGLEPTTYRLTAECSTIELSRHRIYYMKLYS